jgi:protein involved in polysaccharide export with SLBB domain
MKSVRFRFPLSTSGAIAAQERGHFSVFGEANKPGVFEFQGGMTVKEAAVLFEGVTQNASMSRIVILRRSTGKRKRIPIDFEGILSGTKADVPIVDDDIIVIPDSASVKSRDQM